VPPSLGDRLTHILQAIDDIDKLLQSRSRAEFASDIMLRLAVERLFEIISEASRFIPEDLKAKSANIPWRRIADLGNWLRHAYHSHRCRHSLEHRRERSCPAEAVR
jgi:uncharacterized protein with HEPN domain